MKTKIKALHFAAAICVFAATTTMLTSCDKVGGAIVNTFNIAGCAQGIQKYCDWNSETKRYEKHFGCEYDARATLRRYTNYMMDVPGTWREDDDHYIKATKGTGAVAYIVTVKCAMSNGEDIDMTVYYINDNSAPVVLFTESVKAITSASAYTYNNTTKRYEASYDSADDAYNAIRDFTKEQMSVPGSWVLDDNHQIKVTKGSGDVFYQLDLKCVQTEPESMSIDNMTIYYVKK